MRRGTTVLRINQWAKEEQGSNEIYPDRPEIQFLEVGASKSFFYASLFYAGKSVKDVNRIDE
jgi:hypothetical protein